MDQLQYFYPPEEVKPKDMLAILRRRKWFIFLMVLIGVGLAIGVSYMETPRWEADGQILLLSRAVAGTSPSEQDQNYTPPLQETIDTQAALILTDEVAYRTLDKLKRAALAEGKHRIEDFGFPEDSDISDKFASKWVRFEVPKLTDDIVVYGTGKSRHAALLLTNAVCQSFVEWKNQIARRSAKSIAKNLQARANAARQRLQIADARYAAFKNAHHVVDLPTQQANLIGMEKDRETEVANNQQALNADQAKLDELTAQVSSATSLLKSQGFDMRDDAVVSKLQDTLSQDEQNLLV
ncbi:MAG TPA: Wzz/FepE/Etk N-terminal domain-containing protein, partial [Chthonomonadales bacterium]|nr:Wzz/FepE/Etk N-terminal domain-containing protein [Chthonomonadales bacterium]